VFSLRGFGMDLESILQIKVGAAAARDEEVIAQCILGSEATKSGHATRIIHLEHTGPFWPNWPSFPVTAFSKIGETLR
jgi:hypothetical protein